MVFTLHRYIFRELLRIFILATVGLTLILSLGGVLRPMQEYGVGPRQVVHILLYFMPITLTFILPMAALFASALAYGRFASDNEIDACRASGISMVTLIYPGLALAVFVAIANLLLSFHVMPYFVHLAERSLKADAKQILFRNIQRRGYYSLPPDGRFLIYADHADLKENALFGIVVVQSDRETVKRVITSEFTKVQFDPHDKYNEVHLATFNSKEMGAVGNDMSGQVDGWAEFKLEFGSLLGDNIKFKRIDEMKQIRANLMLFDPVARIARETYVQLVTELLARDIRNTLHGPDASFCELRSPSRVVRFAASTCSLEAPMAIALAAPIVVEEYDRASGRHLRTLRCEKAEIRVRENAMDPTASLVLHSAREENLGTLLVRCVFEDLSLPMGVRRCLSGKPILEIVAPEHIRAILPESSGPILAEQQELLAKELALTQTDITAEVNSRLVFGIGCIPMILIGIGLGILQRGGHLLSAFGASCLPAAVLVIAIISGKNVMQNAGAGGPSGILIMWGGLAFLILLSMFIYRRLRRG